MDVMKLAHSGDAAKDHLQERHARSVVNVFWRESGGGAIHHFAPRPETIFFVSRAVLRASANYPLESMRVGINKTREHRSVCEPASTSQVRGSGQVNNLAGIINGKTFSGYELAGREERFGQPKCLLGIIQDR